MNTSKILKLSFFLFSFSIIGFKAIIAMDEEREEAKAKNRISVYSHGFGESGNGKGPNYPDAPGQISKGVFYTKPAVHTLANYLKQKVDQGYNAIDLEARSIGAGTAINCLDKLIHYDQNPGYFSRTLIKSKDDADTIIAAINNGLLDITVPALSLKKTNRVAIPSKYLGHTGITVACYTAYRWGLFDKVLEMAGINLAIARNVASFVTTVAANILLLSTAKNLCSTIIDTIFVPPITRFNYNPFHTKPINAVEGLRRKIKCPILIHYCKQDGVIENPDEDTVKFYETLRDGNEKQTHIYLSEPGDGSHNVESAGHGAVRMEFYSKYKIGNFQELDKMPWLTKTQPSIEELRKQIYNPTHK